MVKFLIKRPIGVFTATTALLILGLVATFKIPISLIPDIPIPEISIQVSYPNSDARELESNLIRPLRNHLTQIPNIKNIQSETKDGFSIILLNFNYGVDIDYAFIEANEKVDAALNFLPRDLDRPKVVKASTTDIPLLYLTVSLSGNYSDKAFLELSSFVENILKKRIEQLPDIAMADVSGLSESEISITPDLKKMSSLGISDEQLASVIIENNFDLGNSLIQNGKYIYNFKISNPLNTKTDIENIYLSSNGKILQIKDLADVNLEPKPNKGAIFYNGKRAISMAIIKKSDARIYDLKESLQSLIDNFKKEYPNLVFETNQDQSELLEYSINSLKSSLVFGSLLAIVIMFFFNSNYKLPLIIAISIPSSLILSMLLLYLLGLSFNIISLSGLILGVGLMIDNSIIVIDNITQKLKKGIPLIQSCVKGTEEIISPLLSSALTTCSVFLPLIFLSGITGALFYDQAIAVSIGLLSSILISIFFIPVLLKVLLKKQINFEGKMLFKINSSSLENKYLSLNSYFKKRKWVIYLLSIISIVIAALLFYRMEYTQLPELKYSQAIMKIDWNENISIKENQFRTNQIIKQNPEITKNYIELGEQQFLLQTNNFKSPSESSIFFEYNMNLDTLKKRINLNVLDKYPNAILTYSPPKTIFQYLFGTKESHIVAQVKSKINLKLPPHNQLAKIQNLLKNKTDSKIPLKKVRQINIIHEKLLLYNVDHIHLINLLKSYFNERFIDNLKSPNKFIPIRFKLNDINEKIELNNIFIVNTKGVRIPIKNLIEIHDTIEYKSIKANKEGEFLEFNINSNKSNTKKEIEEILNDFKAHDDLIVAFGGNWSNLSKLKSELILVSLISLCLLYLILSTQFESLVQPLIILLEIPIDLGGALFFLWLFNGTINIMAAIGFVVMSGIIINDSILKIHTINSYRKQGLNIEDAIRLAGIARLKPIIMTSITTILALAPFLVFDGIGTQLQKPLALTIIGGMLLGTFISIFYIPILYKLLYNQKLI